MSQDLREEMCYCRRILRTRNTMAAAAVRQRLLCQKLIVLVEVVRPVLVWENWAAAEQAALQATEQMLRVSRLKHMEEPGPRPSPRQTLRLVSTRPSVSQCGPANAGLSAPVETGKCFQLINL